MDRTDSRIVIARADCVDLFSADQEKSAVPWIYLGKDVFQRSRAESRLNPAHRLNTGERFHRLAELYRQPFLDFVASIGAAQPDPVTWWSTSFSWKMWESCDLFLLITYLALATELIQETASAPDGRLILVVEDPWLLSQLKENPQVQCVGSSSLTGRKISSFFLGAARRAAWLGRTLRDLQRQKHWTPKGSPAAPEKPSIALYAFPLKESFVGESGWQDPYLPGLDHLLGKLGYEVIRFTPPAVRGFERELAERHRTFQPLILHATAVGILKSLLAFWKFRGSKTATVRSLPVHRLIEREEWLELSRANLCSNRLFYECANEMPQRGNWRWVIFPHENQPWEKLAVLAARQSGVRTVGIQTAIISRYYLPHLLGKGEQTFMPLPDLISTPGPAFRNLLLEGGIPPERLIMTGTIRYPQLNKIKTFTAEPPLRPAAEQKQVLILLPIDRCLAEHLLYALQAAFPDDGESAGVRLQVRSHPMHPLDLSRWGLKNQAAPSGFQDLDQSLLTADLVLFAGSTVGLEALAARRKVLRYRSDSLLDVDEIYGDQIPVCRDQTLRQAVQRGLSDDFVDSLQARNFIESLFSPLEVETLAQIFAVRSPQPQERAFSTVVK